MANTVVGVQVGDGCAADVDQSGFRQRIRFCSGLWLSPT